MWNACNCYPLHVLNIGQEMEVVLFKFPVHCYDKTWWNASLSLRPWRYVIFEIHANDKFWLNMLMHSLPPLPVYCITRLCHSWDGYWHLLDPGSHFCCCYCYLSMGAFWSFWMLSFSQSPRTVASPVCWFAKSVWKIYFPWIIHLISKYGSILRILPSIYFFL